MVGRRGGRRHPPASVSESTSGPSGTVGLFVSILVRYPEVASVTYRRGTRSLRLAVLVKADLPAERASAFRDLVAKSVQAYARLTGSEVRVFDLGVKTRGSVTVVEMWRDIDSLTHGELSMILCVARDFFADQLVIDQIPHVEVEELAVQEELIEEMLDDLRTSRQQPNLIAFREEGRVLVFNQ